MSPDERDTPRDSDSRAEPAGETPPPIERIDAEGEPSVIPTETNAEAGERFDPLRNERDMFKILLYVAGFAVLVIVVVSLIRWAVTGF